MSDIKPYTSAQNDLAEIISKVTCGLETATPIQEDYVLAGEVFIFINNQLKKRGHNG